MGAATAASVKAVRDVHIKAQTAHPDPNTAGARIRRQLHDRFCDSASCTWEEELFETASGCPRVPLSSLARVIEPNHDELQKIRRSSLQFLPSARRVTRTASLSHPQDVDKRLLLVYNMLRAAMSHRVSPTSHRAPRVLPTAEET